MPTFLGDKYSPDWRGRPPHMLWPDLPVWWRFLDRYGPAILALYYDVTVGGPSPSWNLIEDPILRSWSYLTSKRIDVIAELFNEIWLIEVSDNPGMRAIGQLETYKALWAEDPLINKPVLPSIVGSYVDRDVISVAGRLGYQVFIYPPVTGSLR